MLAWAWGTGERGCPVRRRSTLTRSSRLPSSMRKSVRPVKSASRLARSMCFPCVRGRPRGECWLSQSGKGHRFRRKNAIVPASAGEACVKACNFGAIGMENGVPKIDYEKCVGCMACADACPTGAMEADSETRKRGLYRSEQVCGLHHVRQTVQVRRHRRCAQSSRTRVLGACTGCGPCAAKCPKKAITMRDRRAPRNKLDKVEKAPASRRRNPLLRLPQSLPLRLHRG